MERSCLDCRWLDDSLLPGRWHQCVWPRPAALPLALHLGGGQVNIDAPFRDCAVWEGRVTREVEPKGADLAPGWLARQAAHVR